VSENEFSHIIKLDTIGELRKVTLTANAEERARVASRFDLLALEKLEANCEIQRDGDMVRAKGHFSAVASQACIASGEPIPVDISEALHILFIPVPDHAPDAEIELDPDDCDSIFHDGKVIDLGEAVAQTLGLSLDPYPRSPTAETALRAAGVKSEEEAGAFGALADLKAKLEKNV
jgi:uncharacterized metal-binding protein YceD (DUF177 family)